MKRQNNPSLLAMLAMAALIVGGCMLAGRGLSGSRADVAAPLVVINEVMSKNSITLADDRGEYPDWVEIKNIGTESADLSGWMLMGGKTSDAFMFGRHVLAPGETALIFLSGLNQSKPGYVYHAPFKLSASGDTVTLLNSSAQLVSQLDVPALEADVSYARGDDGVYYICYAPTPGADNASEAAFASAGLEQVVSPVRINEIMASNATYVLPDGCLCDWVELYNDSADYVVLDGYALTDDIAKPQKQPLDGVSIGPYGCTLIHLNGRSNQAGHADFGLSSVGETVYLTLDGGIADSVAYEDLATDVSFSLWNGAWVSNMPPTPGLINTFDSAAQVAADFENQKRSVLVINEVCYATTTQVDARNSFDWLELRNTGSQTISLEGYGLSDDPGHPRKWQFPAGASIPAGGYLVVMFGEGDSTQLDSRGYYRTGFSLSSGESVTLCAPDGTIMDRVPVMPQYGEISCGRVDGQSGFFYFEESTIGAYNGTTGLRSRCQKPVFSVTGGLYDANELLMVSISSDPDSVIYYTTDCTQPTTSSLVYTGPIQVSGNTVIRAIAARRDAITSYTATETYLFGLSHSIRVVSLVADPDDLYSSDRGIITNELKSWERQANVEIYASDGTVIQPSQGCGVALNGDASRRLDMKSFRILGRSCYDETNSFTSDLFTSRDYDGYRSFLLRGGGQDNTRALIRDPFIDCLAADTQVYYQESEMCVLYLNGEFYGVYNIRERISTFSICDFMGWKRTKRMDLIKGNDLTQNGSNSDYVDILSWIKSNPTATDENIAYLETRIDLDNYIDYMCFMVYSANQDIGVRRYRSWDGDGLWRWVVYDQDFGFYNDTNSIARWMDPDGAGSGKTVENKLFRYLMSNDKVVERYLTRFGELLAGPWAPDALLVKFDALVDTIRPEMPLHCQKWASTLTYSRWESQIAFLRERIQERAGKIIGYLSDYFKLTDAQKESYFGEALRRIGQ